MDVEDQEVEAGTGVDRIALPLAQWLVWEVILA
jgi:hypothetical protein